MSTILDFKNLTTDEQLYIKAKIAYYGSGNPIMDDPTFDLLEDKLAQIDSNIIHIVGLPKISKSGKISFKKGKNKVFNHITPMGSLAKIKFQKDYTPYQEFIAWINKHTNNTVNIEYTPKLDGNAINLIYENGKLEKILSRGDGLEGQDYTEIMKHAVPNIIKGFTGEIRGEAVIDTYIFDTKFGKQSNLEKPYANARNFVAGALNSGEKDKCQYIDIVAFQIVNFDGNTFNQLIQWGFEVVDFMQSFPSDITEDEFVGVYTLFKNYREKCKYQLDGIVAKMPEEFREDIGGNSHHPYWAMAIKFVTEEVTTTIIDIEWSLGKRGQLAPVAILEPVELLGSIVTKASVYNASWMLANKCFPGATITLVKSGDIIPKIVDIIQPSTETFELPTIWNDYETNFDGVQLMLNDFESTDEFKSLQLHNSIVALGIKGIGPATATKLVDAGITLNDLITQSPNDLRDMLIDSTIFRLGRELDILMDNVYALNKVELWQVIYAMGYRNCGTTISKQLANWIVKIDYDFKGLEKQVIEDFIYNDERIDEVKTLVGALIQNNVEVVKPVKISKDILTFEMSGDVSSNHGSKGEFKREVESSGKVMHTSLNKNTDYLVVASMAIETTKMKKAKKNGTKIIEYSEFLNIVKTL
jgi:DNA ligase (NAD+)